MSRTPLPASGPLYIPQPTAWESDPIGSLALKLAGFCLFMSGVYGAVQLIEIMVR